MLLMVVVVVIVDAIVLIVLVDPIEVEVHCKLNFIFFGNKELK